MPSGNFFLVLNRSHQFLLKKVRIQNLLGQLEHNDLNLITLLCCIKFESFCSSCFIKFRPFLNKKWWLLLKTTKEIPGWHKPETRVNKFRVCQPQFYKLFLPVARFATDFKFPTTKIVCLSILVNTQHDIIKAVMMGLLRAVVDLLPLDLMVF